MIPFFSIVIPTRHRPEFLDQSLCYISKQSFTDYEVIVSDNFSDAKFSSKFIFDKWKQKNWKYIKPSKTLGMVENWNYALGYCNGKYVIYLTDKMFLLPDILIDAYNVLRDNPVDIINWIDDIYTSIDLNSYFGKGAYSTSISSIDKDKLFEYYQPLDELSKKGLAEVSREEQSRSHYARGKICFGAYSADLIKKIQENYGPIFQSISPDYTSMILALSCCNNAIELRRPGIAHINTNISNGGLAAINDSFALDYLNILGDIKSYMDNMLVKGLYSSQHNMVSHDYLFLKNKFNLPFEFNHLNWLKHIYIDLYVKEREWSTIFIECEQKSYFINHINSLVDKDKQRFEEMINSFKEKRTIKKNQLSEDKLSTSEKRSLLRSVIKYIIPHGLLMSYIKFKIKKDNKKMPKGYYNSLNDAIMAKKEYKNG